MTASRRSLPLLFIVGILSLTLPLLTLSQVLPFHTYTVTDGLISNSINVLHQDSRGFLWIGTNDGLSIYDGRSFSDYSRSDGLPSDYVYEILEDRFNQGTVWIGTIDGLSKFLSGKFTNYRVGKSVETNRINSLVQDRQGTIWCGTDDGVYRLEGDTFTSVEQEGNVGLVEKIALLADGTMWVGGDSGLIRVSPESKTANRYRLGRFGSERVRTMFVDTKDTLWVGTKEGSIYKYYGSKVLSHRETGLGPITFITRDKDGSLWWGSRSGLSRMLDKGQKALEFVLYTDQNGLPDNFVSTGVIDGENNLWIGTINKGITRLTEKRYFKFPVSGLVQAANNSMLATDSNDHFWLVSGGGLLEFWRKPDGTWHRFLHREHEGKRWARPHAIKFDHRGRLWLVYADGSLRSFLLRSHPNTKAELELLTEYQPKTGRAEILPLCFIVDRKDCVWYSIEGVGVLLLDFRKSPSLLRSFTVTDGLPSMSIRALYEDKNGDIWFGSFDAGLTRYSLDSSGQGVFTRLTSKDGLPDNGIRAILRGQSGDLYVGTRFGGIAIIRPDSMLTFSRGGGLPSNTVWSISEGEDRKPWLGTHLGLVQFERRG